MTKETDSVSSLPFLPNEDSLLTAGAVHTVGAPLAHVARPFIKPFWLKFSSFKDLQRDNVKIVQGRLTKVDLQAKRLHHTQGQDWTKDSTLEYDYLITATGLKRPFPIVPSKLTFDDYVKDAEGLVHSLEKARNPAAVIVGGGK